MNIPRQCSGELYKFLELANTASNSDIKKSYHRLALRLHPDKTGGQTTEEFKRIVEANSILSDPEQRKLYDKIGRSGLSKLNQYGMDSTMTSFLAHPQAIAFLLFLMWLFSALLLVFLILVNINIDSNKGWRWSVVFVPIWVICVPLLFMAVSILISGVRHRKYSMVLGGLQVLLSIASVCCLVSSLDKHLCWKITFEVICGAYMILIIREILDLRLSRFKEYLAMSGYPDPLGVTWTSPIYVKHVITSILNTALILLFIILLSLRIVIKKYDNMNFYVIFSPLFICNLVPMIFVMIEFIVCPSQSEEKTTKSKIITIIKHLLICAIKQYTFILVAVKCQRELNQGLKGPSASICTIPLYILFGVMVSMICCACTYSFLVKDSDSEDESILKGQDNTEYTACSAKQTQRKSYKTAADIDN
eukprot:Tbor_TRINITY_DN5621_c1_g1::TRINITY_DN5621_c1_g1_i2::g.8322::m.8322